MKIEVDLVYLWVDGSDPVWREKHDRWVGVVTEGSGVNCEGRYEDNDELKYSLRSVARHAPWVRGIFIVTDGQTPSWLDTSHPKVRIVDHTEILPPEVLPTFNSNVLEHVLFRIPGLSEHFIFSNDDMFLNRDVSPSDFFTPEGLPIVRLNRRPMRRLTLWAKQHLLGDSLSSYNRSIHNTATLVARRYGHYIGGKNHHNIDAYLRSQYEHTYHTFRDAIEPTLANHLRSDTDLQRNLYSYLPMIEGKCRVEYVDDSTSFKLHTHRPNHYARLEQKNPVFFCVNDSEYATEADRKRAREFLAGKFPEKSPFEK